MGERVISPKSYKWSGEVHVRPVRGGPPLGTVAFRCGFCEHVGKQPTGQTQDRHGGAFARWVRADDFRWV